MLSLCSNLCRRLLPLLIVLPMVFVSCHEDDDVGSVIHERWDITIPDIVLIVAALIVFIWLTIHNLRKSKDN